MIDDYAKNEPVTRCEPIWGDDLERERPGVHEFRSMVLDAYGGADVGVSRACDPENASSAHHEARAWDWGQPSNAAADALIAELLASDDEGNEHAKLRRLGLRAIIWNRKIWTAGTKQWAPYRGDDPHTSHVHFRFSWDGALGRTSGYSGAPVIEGGSGPVRLLPFRGDGDGPCDRGGEDKEQDPVSFFAWQTDRSGLVLVDVNDGAGLQPVTITSEPLSKLADDVWRKWGKLIADKARKYSVPRSWIAGVILQESGGDPSARSPAGAVGLMQIMTSIHPLTEAQALDPAQNVDYGAKLLRDSIALGFDLPEAASRYNAGAKSTGQPHDSATSPWGIREQPGYISGVVRGSNYFHGRIGAGPGSFAVRVTPLALMLAAGALWYIGTRA